MSRVIYILSIDGGGIRGIIPARILHRIETDSRINKSGDNTFIYNKFNVFAGSSSGSILVSGLSYHKSSMAYIIDNYINFENFNRIMPNNYRRVGTVCLSIFIIIFCVALGFYMSQTFTGISMGILMGIIASVIIGVILLFDTPLYPKDGKTKMIEDYIGKNTIFTSENNKDVFILAYNMSKQRPEFFKSWDQNNYLIKDIIDASSAVPGLYSAIKINNSFYIDGGVTTNNPTDCVYSEILKKYKNDKVKIKILSLGCGRKKQFKVNNNITDWGHLRWVISGNVGLFIGDEQMVDTRLKNFTEVLGDSYIRIDGEIDNLLFTDTSNTYKDKLNDIADLWYEENRDMLIEFFDK